MIYKIRMTNRLPVETPFIFDGARFSRENTHLKMFSEAIFFGKNILGTSHFMIYSCNLSLPQVRSTQLVGVRETV